MSLTTRYNIKSISFTVTKPIGKNVEVIERLKLFS